MVPIPLQSYRLQPRLGFDAEGSSCLWWCRKARQKRHGSDRVATWELGDHMFHVTPPESNITPWKINMEPENDGLEDDFPFQLGDF